MTHLCLLVVTRSKLYLRLLVSELYLELLLLFFLRVRFYFRSFVFGLKGNLLFNNLDSCRRRD